MSRKTPILPTVAALAACGASGPRPEWVRLPGGKFTMGAAAGGKRFDNARPVREVTVREFELSRTPVTVAQYAECVAAGACAEPGTDDFCNWGIKGREDHPVNCVDWHQAAAYAAYAGARLPSEAEWEYAARSGGLEREHPWGNEAPDCSRTVMSAGAHGCGSGGTLAVCSKPAGDTAQGLCDMAGNVWEWLQDNYADSYAGAPSDGAAFEGEGFVKVLRGGAFNLATPEPFRVYYRNGGGRGDRYGYIGFRLARDPR